MSPVRFQRETVASVVVMLEDGAAFVVGGDRSGDHNTVSRMKKPQQDGRVFVRPEARQFRSCCFVLLGRGAMVSRACDLGGVDRSGKSIASVG